MFARMIIYNVQSFLQLLVAAVGTLSSLGLLSHASMPNGTLPNGTHTSHPAASGAHKQSSSPEQVSFPVSVPVNCNPRCSTGVYKLEQDAFPCRTLHIASHL